VVCATHQDLKALIKEHRFREDLYYRLAEIVVDIPPLRARQGDAVLLAHAFLRRFAQEQRRGAMGFTDDAVRAIEAHAWPGNVRELLNAVKRAAIMADGQRVGADDIGLPVPPVPSAEGAEAGEDTDRLPRELDLRAVREAAERQAIISALARTNSNIAKASELLGVSRPTLYDLMHKLAIK
jgi:two-component system NtrC family response regulator